MTVKQAIARQTAVVLADLYFEHTVVNADADDPAKRYKLYSIVEDLPNRIVCAPDGSFELQVQQFRRAYYLELERGTDTPQRAAAKKSPGYHGLFKRELWKRHYPLSADFRVLCITLTRTWRDAFRKAMKDKAGADLWFFVSLDELKPETFLHTPIIYTCAEGPRPLIRPEALPAAPPQQG